MKEQILIEKDEQQLTVSEKAFELIYKGHGFVKAENEINSETDKRVVAVTAKAGDSGQSGPAKRSGTGKPDKTKDSDRT